MTYVTWKEWILTWSHPSGGDFGRYERRERSFKTAAEANAFAEGLKKASHVSSVEVRS